MAEGQDGIGVQELKDMARYFHALRDVLRLRILITLAESGEMTVTELPISLSGVAIRVAVTTIGFCSAAAPSGAHRAISRTPAIPAGCAG